MSPFFTPFCTPRQFGVSASLNTPIRLRFQIFCFEIRHFFQDLLGSEPRRKEIENINNANTHAAYARSTTTLVRIDCDSLQQISH